MMPLKEPIRMKTVEIKCIAEKGRPSYYANGVPQEMGDRARLPLGDALGLVRAGKATIIDGTEKVESVGFAPPDPPPARHWSASKW